MDLFEDAMCNHLLGVGELKLTNKLVHLDNGHLAQFIYIDATDGDCKGLGLQTLAVTDRARHITHISCNFALDHVTAGFTISPLKVVDNTLVGNVEGA